MSTKKTSAFLLLIFVFLLSTSFLVAEVDLSNFRLPPGFRIAIFADTPGHPRMMTFSPGGVLMATSQADGKVWAFPDAQHSGRAERVVTVLEDMDAPHGIAFHNGKLYIAETGKVIRFDWDESNFRATNPHTIIELPRGGGHITRTILFANGKLYVSVGSSCNVCVDAPRRAVVLKYNEDGSGEKVFARGLRNAVGLAFNHRTRTVWVTDNGRDWLGDNLPPDTIYDLGTKGGDFGWPYCYGKRVPDLKFSKDDASRCAATVPSKVDLQAHSAPLGLAFYDGSGFPAQYRGDLFVAFHGSWNRSVPTGYKVVRIKMNKDLQPQGVEDFLTGFIRPGETGKGVWMGRPVGVIVAADGAMLVSDDASGPIYRITYGAK